MWHPEGVEKEKGEKWEMSESGRFLVYRQKIQNKERNSRNKVKTSDFLKTE